MRPYSHRLTWPVSSNSLTDAIERKRESRVPLLDLTVSNPTEIFADYPHAAIARALAETGDLAYRPHPLGEERARSAIADFYASRGINNSPARLALTASTSEAYALLFKLLCDPGDEILAPLPSYPLFEYLGALESVRISFYRLAYDGSWFVDFDSLRRQINEHTRAIVLVNPNNPTGSFLKPSEARELLHIAGERGLPLISDEVFLDYALAPAANRVPTLIGSDSVLSFSLNGLSKSAGMPQMKLAWIAINGPEPQCSVARDRLELILDTYLSVNTPVQRALPKLLPIGARMRDRILGRIETNVDTLQKLLQGSPAHPLHLEGGWSAIVQLPRIDQQDWPEKLLAERNVIVQPGYFYDLPMEACVVSLITPPTIFHQGIAALLELLTEPRP
ncbi:MAG: pyridoxal phosphate-dependent aminotransferase [Bryobacteraceae bacterium]